MSESIPKRETPSRPLQQPTNTPAPDPSGGPTAVPVSPILHSIGTIGLTVVSGGAALLFAGAMLTPCVGATRSARLSPEQRRQEIAKAILQINADETHSGSPRATDAEQ